MPPTKPDQPTEEHQVTRLLRRTRDGEEDAKEELVALVYQQLHRIARIRMARERPDHTLQPTELVHEAYVKMAGYIEDQEWSGRAQFYGAAAEAMRRILINYARSRNTVKRGSGQAPAVVNVLDLSQEQCPEHILALNEAIKNLREHDPKIGQLVYLRFYAGLSLEETAETLGISVRSVTRHWTYARAWLARELGGQS